LPLVYKIVLPFGSAPNTIGCPRVVRGNDAKTDAKNKSITKICFSLKNDYLLNVQLICLARRTKNESKIN
jgi:hypothetical protein